QGRHRDEGEQSGGGKRRQTGHMQEPVTEQGL
ncbi:MAG: hypothetical protein ACI9YM_002759, partial [Brevundimonas sp.]